MTTNIATFTFSNRQTDLDTVRVSRVTRDPDIQVDDATADKAKAEMAKTFKAVVDVLKKIEHKSTYTELKTNKRFKVSVVESSENNKAFLHIFYKSSKQQEILQMPLTEGTFKSLKNSLITAATSTTALNPILPTVEQQNRLLTTPPNLIPTRPRGAVANTLPTILPTSSTSANQIPPVKGQTAENTPPAHGLVYRFFAAILNYFLSFFYDTPEEPTTTVTTPLVQGGQAQRSTSASTGKTTTAQTRKVAADIRPLRNGNNICFINTIFQALMNMPELKDLLIKAHQEKIQRERIKLNALPLQISGLVNEIESIQTQIQTLTATYSWYSYLLPDPAYDKLIKQIQAPIKKHKASLEAQTNIRDSITASETLIQALSTYNDGTTKDFVWLNPLRGFNSAFSGWSEEDASELLYHILDPLLEPLRGGQNQHGIPSMDIIPENTNPLLKTALSNFIPKFGTEREWVQKNDSTHKELRKGVSIASILPFEMPNEDTTLQALITAQLKLQPVPFPYVYDGDINGVHGNYQASKERFVIQSLEGNAPKYIPIQLKRFNADQSKNRSAIALPENNTITLVVDENNVDYEIHTLAMHRGDSPSGGHYFSYVRKNDGWHEANDGYVSASLAQLPSSVEEEVYVVFLKRIDREVI
jgi:ubiquitin C-terminal hydrolase